MSKTSKINYGVCNCANCGRIPTMTKTVKYRGVDITWYFCSEKCYCKWLRRMEREGKVIPVKEKVIFT